MILHARTLDTYIYGQLSTSGETILSDPLSCAYSRRNITTASLHRFQIQQNNWGSQKFSIWGFSEHETLNDKREVIRNTSYVLFGNNLANVCCWWFLLTRELDFDNVHLRFFGLHSPLLNEGLVCGVGFREGKKGGHMGTFSVFTTNTEQQRATWKFSHGIHILGSRCYDVCLEAKEGIHPSGRWRLTTPLTGEFSLEICQFCSMTPIPSATWPSMHQYAARQGCYASECHHYHLSTEMRFLLWPRPRCATKKRSLKGRRFAERNAHSRQLAIGEGLADGNREIARNSLERLDDALIFLTSVQRYQLEHASR